MPNFSLIDENLEVTQEVATFPIYGLWRNSILTNMPTVQAVKTDKIMWNKALEGLNVFNAFSF